MIKSFTQTVSLEDQSINELGSLFLPSGCKYISLMPPETVI